MRLLMLIVVMNGFDFVSSVRFDLVNDGVDQDGRAFHFQPFERRCRVVLGADRADRYTAVAGAAGWSVVVGDPAVAGLRDRDVVVTQCLDSLGESLFAWRKRQRFH